MGHWKTIIKVGQMTAGTGSTLTFPRPEDVNRENFMDVLVDTTGFTGTGTMAFTVEELFSDTYFTTAVSGAVSGTGQTVMTYDQGSISGAANGGHPLLGKGMLKRITSAPTGSVTGIVANVYVVYFGHD